MYDNGIDYPPNQDELDLKVANGGKLKIIDELDPI